MIDYFFAGKQYIRVTRNETELGTMDPGYPALVSDLNWGAFAANGIDAAVYSDVGPFQGSKCYFFAGNQYIRVSCNEAGLGTIDPGFPAPLSSLSWGAFAANGIDAAVYSNIGPFRGSKCYFFSGKQYIRVTLDGTELGTMDPGYPALISDLNWGTFAANGEVSAFYSGSKCYVFSGKQYIQVTLDGTELGTIDPGFPAPLSDWHWGTFAANGLDAAVYVSGVPAALTR